MKLVLNNFRGATKSIDISNKQFIVGGSASGKSQICEALEWCITGKINGLVNSQTGMQKLYEQDTFSVSCSFKNVLLERHVNSGKHSLVVNGTGGSIRENQIGIDETIKICYPKTCSIVSQIEFLNWLVEIFPPPKITEEIQDLIRELSPPDDLRLLRSYSIQNLIINEEFVTDYKNLIKDTIAKLLNARELIHELGIVLTEDQQKKLETSSLNSTLNNLRFLTTQLKLIKGLMYKEIIPDLNKYLSSASDYLFTSKPHLKFKEDLTLDLISDKKVPFYSLSEGQRYAMSVACSAISLQLWPETSILIIESSCMDKELLGRLLGLLKNYPVTYTILTRHQIDVDSDFVVYAL